MEIGKKVTYLFKFCQPMWLSRLYYKFSFIVWKHPSNGGYFRFTGGEGMKSDHRCPCRESFTRCLYCGGYNEGYNEVEAIVRH